MFDFYGLHSIIFQNIRLPQFIDQLFYSTSMDLDQERNKNQVCIILLIWNNRCSCSGCITGLSNYCILLAVARSLSGACHPNQHFHCDLLQRSAKFLLEDIVK
jgi:hypothetical protein